MEAGLSSSKVIGVWPRAPTDLQIVPSLVKLRPTSSGGVDPRLGGCFRGVIQTDEVSETGNWEFETCRFEQIVQKEGLHSKLMDPGNGKKNKAVVLYKPVFVQGLC